MGQGKTIFCSNCDYEEEFLIGKGFYLGGIDDFNQLKEYLKKEHINWPVGLPEHDNAKIIKGPSMEYFKCPVCKTLHNKTYFEVGLDETQIYECEYICQECGSILKPILNRKIYLSKYKCPKCNGKTLEDNMNITNWD